MLINKLFHPTPFAFSILDAVGIGHKKPRAPIGNGSANRGSCKSHRLPWLS